MAATWLEVPRPASDGRAPYLCKSMLLPVTPSGVFPFRPVFRRPSRATIPTYKTGLHDAAKEGLHDQIIWNSAISSCSKRGQKACVQVSCAMTTTARALAADLVLVDPSGVPSRCGDLWQLSEECHAESCCQCHVPRHPRFKHPRSLYFCFGCARRRSRKLRPSAVGQRQPEISSLKTPLFALFPGRLWHLTLTLLAAMAGDRYSCMHQVSFHGIPSSPPKLATPLPGRAILPNVFACSSSISSMRGMSWSWAFQMMSRKTVRGFVQDCWRRHLPFAIVTAGCASWTSAGIPLYMGLPSARPRRLRGGASP